MKYSIGLLAAIISTLFGIYAFTEGKKAKYAVEQKALADAMRVRAETKIQKALAKNKLDKAEADVRATRAEADIKAAKAEADVKAAKAKVALEALRAEAARLKADSANNSLNSILNSLPNILALTKEKFYQSDFMSLNQREMFIDSLFKLKYKHKDSLHFAKLLSDINAIIDINQTAENNPNLALLKAIQLRDSSKSRMADSMLFYVANNYLLG